MHLYNTVILAAGSNSFLLPHGGEESKMAFIVAGEKLIEKITNTYLSGDTYLAVSDETVKVKEERIKIVSVGKTKGALITALIAIRDCDLNLPVFFTPGDALISKEKFEEFRLQSINSDQDVSLIVFDSENPKYSYVRMLEEKLVEVCEKKVISSKATAGIFYFKSANLFIEYAEWAIMNSIQTNGLFYLAPALNYAVVKGFNPILFQINEADYFRFSTLEEAIISEKRYRHANPQN